MPQCQILRKHTAKLTKKFKLFPKLVIVVVDVNGKEALNFCAHWSPEKGFLYGKRVAS